MFSAPPAICVCKPYNKDTPGGGRTTGKYLTLLNAIVNPVKAPFVHYKKTLNATKSGNPQVGDIDVR